MKFLRKGSILQTRNPAAYVAATTAVALGLSLSACGSRALETDEAAIANQAESLERAANATTDQLIRQIEADARREEASGQVDDQADSNGKASDK